MTDLNGAIDSYMTWLEVKSPAHLKEFKVRLETDPEAAASEAATFCLLRLIDLNPKPGEVIGKGGVDFICEPKGREGIAVEVTTVEIATVTKASGLSHPPSTGGEMVGFQQVTGALLREAVNKAEQLAGHDVPRLLVIATQHSGADLLMGAHGARELLTGTTQFSIPIGDSDAEVKVTTALKNSVFFKPSAEGRGIVPARQSISAILLMWVTNADVRLIGLLHPQPAKPFDHELFEHVHFVKLRSWPLTPGVPFGVEWVGPDPSAEIVPHIAVALTKEDLSKL